MLRREPTEPLLETSYELSPGTRIAARPSRIAQAIFLGGALTLLAAFLAYGRDYPATAASSLDDATLGGALLGANKVDSVPAAPSFETFQDHANLQVVD